MFSYVIADLDNTLLNSEKKIGKKTKALMRQIKELNVNIVLATGRHLKDTRKYMQELNLSNGDYIVCCDGMYVFDEKEKMIWKAKALSIEDVHYVEKATKIPRILFYTDKKDYQVIKPLFYRLKMQLLLLKPIIHKQIVVCKTIKRKNIHEIEKICFFRNDIEDSTILDELRNEYTVHILEDGRVEILSKNVCKLTAIKYLMEYRGFNEDSLIYFGDDANDIECFKYLPHTIAMGNACDSIKQDSEEVTKSCDEDGVGYFLEKYLLSEKKMGDISIEKETCI